MTSIVPLMCVCVCMFVYLCIKYFLSFLSHLTLYYERKDKRQKKTHKRGHHSHNRLVTTLHRLTSKIFLLLYHQKFTVLNARMLRSHMPPLEIIKFPGNDQLKFSYSKHFYINFLNLTKSFLLYTHILSHIIFIEFEIYLHQTVHFVPRFTDKLS